jgi:NADH-quinone oxidoreductase subunit J
MLVAFAFLAGGALWGAYRVATASRVTHAALWLAVVLVCTAGFFFLLQADFLATVQLLVYAGGILTVIVFAVMLSELHEIVGEVGGGLWRRVASPYFGLVPLLGAAAVFAVLAAAYARAPWPASPRPAPQDTVALVGGGLFTVYAVPFEVASILLLAALVGAIILSRREESE